MTERSRVSLLNLVHAAHFFLWMVGSAAAECGYFQPLVDLTTEMRMVATDQAPPATATARRVARHVQNVELGEVRLRLQRMNFSAQFRDIEQLTTIASKYSRTKRITDHVALARNLHNVEGLLEKICGSRLKDGPFNKKSGASRKEFLASILESEDSLLKVGLLLFFLIGLIGLLFFFEIHARIRDRVAAPQKNLSRSSSDLRKRADVFRDRDACRPERRAI